MNIRKTRLWLAFTGWLPWACYFGLHHNKLICRGYVLMERPPGSLIPMGAPSAYVKLPFVFVPRTCVCKRFGVAW